MVTLGRTLGWCRAYKRHLMIGGVVVLVLLLAVAGWELYDASRQRSAQAAYNLALDAYESGAYEAALAGFREVEEYGVAPHSDLAALYIANTQLALGANRDAIATLEELTARVSADTLNGQLALLSLALAHERNDDCQSALGIIAHVVGQAGPFEQEALLAKARCSVRAGELENAIGAYRDYLKQFPGSENPEISLKLQELEARASGG